MTLIDNDANCTRPRRLEADTLAYLKEVTESLSTEGQELSDENEESMVMWNVLEEIAPRAASAFSDRHACVLIEKLLPRLNDLQLRFLMSQLIQYTSHLWTNRYSSHVLQRIFAKVHSIVREERDLLSLKDAVAVDSDDVPEVAKDTPYMTLIIESMIRQVQTEWISMICDVSATHVFRSVLAVLAGRSIAPLKRGKRAKHKENAFEFESKVDAESAVKYEMSAQFVDTFRDILMTVVALEVSDLHELVFDRNACPFIMVLVQLAPTQARKLLIHRILQWSSKVSPNENTAKLFYDFAGDSVASHFLETVIQCLEKNDFDRLFHDCLKDRLIEFSEHKISNFVVQYVLQSITDSEMAFLAIHELKPFIWKLFSIHHVGVVWRLVQVCGRLKLQQKEIVDAIQQAIEKLEHAKSTPVQRNWISALLSLELPTSSFTSTRLSLNVLGARIFFEFMHFEDEEMIKMLFESFFASMNTTQLTALARDASGSRFIIEPIWENASANRTWIIHLLYEKLIGQFGFLATDRIGVFTVMKCYQSIFNLAEKEIIVKELALHESKLVGSHFAQHALQLCHVYEYKKDINAWRALYQRSEKVVDLFQDVFESAEPNNSNMKKKKSKKANMSSIEKKESDSLRVPCASDDVNTALKAVARSSKSKKSRKGKAMA